MQIKYSIILLIFIINSCNNSNTKINKVNDTFFCDVEKSNETGKTLYDKKNNNILFQGYDLRTNEESYSGNYSLKLTKEKPYAFSFEIPSIEKDQHYKVSVRLKGATEDAKIVAQGSNMYYRASNPISGEEENGWKILTLDFYLPPYFTPKDNIKISVWNSGNNTIYADDLKIEFIPNNITYTYKEETLRIFIEDDELKKLEEIRKIAFKNEILETTDDSWVNAVILYGDKDFKAKVRFKGDWLDHLNGIKWSFRIKLKKGGAFLGMREFSIQTPSARHFLDEWVAHKLFAKEGLLTTRYDFVPVYLNEKNLGLYVYEEHFTKQLIENNQRREGPIIKFSEDQLWKSRVYKEDKNLPHFYASEIIPFKKNKTLSNINLKHQFENAQNLLYQYKFFTKKTSQIFDIDKLAKYFALIDITKSYHGLIWHNQRFYYNPVLSRLEPIAYDNYSDAGVMQYTDRAIYGNIKLNRMNNEPNGFNNSLLLFSDSSFRKLYIHYLKKYTEDEYLTKFFDNYKDEIIHHSQNLKVEFPDYQYDNSFLYTNTILIKKELEHFIKNSDIQSNSPHTLKLSKSYKTAYNKEIAPYFVKAYLNHSQIKIINNYPHEIKILGISTNNRIISNSFSEKINLNFLESTKISVESEDNLFLFFKINNKNDTLSLKINKQKFPIDYNPEQQISEETNFKDNKNFIIKDYKVTFKKGKKIIKENIVIPKGYKVIFEAGVNLDFINHSMFLSYSPIFLLGKNNNTIIIQSTDQTAKGFTVIQAKEKSIVNHTIFKNLSTLSYKGWSLTGAVNFYESEVEIMNSTFENNYCEDALNIIRSDFYIENSKFFNIASDAFDSDFCTGIIKNCEFYDIKNDAMDFSGSNIIISDCKINNAGDKGVSGGENSTLSIENTIINNSKIGFASKDKSNLTLSNCIIENCQFGLVAFQKKPEYSYAIIKANNIKINNIITLYAIEKNSQLILNNQKIPGNIKNLSERFY